MKRLLIIFLLLPISAFAQYKCVENGHTLYAERPCDHFAKPLELKADTPVTDEDRKAAKMAYLKQKAAFISALVPGARGTHEQLMYEEHIATNDLMHATSK